jgi:hypothetical protein
MKKPSIAGNVPVYATAKPKNSFGTINPKRSSVTRVNVAELGSQ